MGVRRRRRGQLLDQVSAKNPVATRFGENLRRCRKAAGWSQEALGFRADLHRTYIGILERGESLPRIETVVRLAGALGVTVYNLLDGIEWNPGSTKKGAWLPM